MRRHDTNSFVEQVQLQSELQYPHTYNSLLQASNWRGDLEVCAAGGNISDFKCSHYQDLSSQSRSGHATAGATAQYPF